MAMKKLRVTYELIDERGEILHSRAHEMRPSEGIPCRSMPLRCDGSGLQISSHNEAIRFWREILMLGLLDDYARDRHSPMLLPPLKGDGE